MLGATDPIRPLAWEPPYAMDAALKRKKKKRSEVRFWNEVVGSHPGLFPTAGEATLFPSAHPCALELGSPELSHLNIFLRNLPIFFFLAFLYF